MEPTAVESISITERVNGWWVTVRYVAGSEEHHGPYATEEEAESEADLLDPARQVTDNP